MPPLTERDKNGCGLAIIAQNLAHKLDNKGILNCRLCGLEDVHGKIPSLIDRELHGSLQLFGAVRRWLRKCDLNDRLLVMMTVDRGHEYSAHFGQSFPVLMNSGPIATPSSRATMPGNSRSSSRQMPRAAIWTAASYSSRVISPLSIRMPPSARHSASVLSSLRSQRRAARACGSLLSRVPRNSPTRPIGQRCNRTIQSG